MADNTGSVGTGQSSVQYLQMDMNQNQEKADFAYDGSENGLKEER